ncbi:hypothetical protein ACPCBX_34330 [Streptomyces tuirus]|uniref:hypothetical protein n=1 Tax=Streptomyces tuirus TaxID=68278 RepID=UPI0038CD3426
MGRLERRLQATLLEPGSRAVALTEAGAVLLREARAALDAVEAAEGRTRRGRGRRTPHPSRGVRDDRQGRGRPRHEGRRVRRTAGGTPRRPRRRTRRGHRRSAPVRHGRAGPDAARPPGRRGAAAPAAPARALVRPTTAGRAENVAMYCTQYVARPSRLPPPSQ